MKALAIKKEMHHVIDVIEDKDFLKAIYTILEAHVKSSEIDFEFSPEHIKELNKRRKAHLEGKSKSYTFADIKKQIVSKSKK